MDRAAWWQNLGIKTVIIHTRARASAQMKHAKHDKPLETENVYYKRFCQNINSETLPAIKGNLTSVYKRIWLKYMTNIGSDKRWTQVKIVLKSHASVKTKCAILTPCHKKNHNNMCMCVGEPECVLSEIFWK